MSEFDQIRGELRGAYAALEAATGRVAVAKQGLASLLEQERQLNRVFDPRNESHASQRAALAGQIKEARARVSAQAKSVKEALLAAGDLVGRFARFTQPDEAIRRLNDAFPILLFPVRLETRFKTIPGVQGTTRRELWVRVYPDDCSVDTFEGTLSETEVSNARLYWTGMWEAGGIEEQERGAWRGLVASHGSGRAEWIISQYRPLNPGAKPVKAAATDLVLTIPTDDPPSDPEASALAAFWPAIWRADGGTTQTAAALAGLEAAVGTARAAELIDRYPPANLNAKPPRPLGRDEVNVSAAFVVFPAPADIETKKSSWSRAPRATLLPDRFVFLGYAGDAAPVTVIGQPVPPELIAGPDPTADEADRLRHDADGNLVIPDEMRWMVDFERAVAAGMGFRVVLDETRAAGGFDRVIVVGLRFNADEEQARQELETLLTHHRFGRHGLSLIPQGTPTNNTETSNSGFSRGDDPDLSFDDLSKPTLFTPDPDWRNKPDGQWLAEYLGIDPAVVQKLRNAGGRDQADVRAMNTALFPATLGYWMETLMQPVFPQAATDRTRDFFNSFVSGRGPVPAIRIGTQPYGILPATALSRMAWMKGGGEGGTLPAPGSQFLSRLYAILLTMREDWRAMSGSVSFVGSASDPGQTLLDIVGLHPNSVEYAQRYAETITQFYNRLNLSGVGEFFSILVIAGLQGAGADLLGKFGLAGDPPAKILELLFFGRHNELRGPVVDDVPLSETAPIRVYTEDGLRNYIEWLIDAANANTLYQQTGFKDGKVPQALLYIVLRHALQLGYHDTSIRLHEAAGLLDAGSAAAARVDQPFLHISRQAPVSESRYQVLYKAEPAITGDPALRVADFIASSLSVLVEARSLREQVEALERLKQASTARLERAFSEHIDCCSYRLDAWFRGLLTYQLTLMRHIQDRQEGPPRKGVYVGAYAWLENLRPEEKVLSSVALRDPELAAAFNRPQDPPLTRDSHNQGFIHAPSLNHAVTAAVLRNGYLSNASPQNRQTMAVNLTSERVRVAMAMLEGIRGGQSLGALLGYQFERGLHDSHDLAEVDKFIFKLRKAFPLAADHLASTATEEGVSIEAIESRNVMDGLALVNHLKSGAPATYPFGKNLPAATSAEQAALDAQARRLLESHDAVADLALAEGVYQAVLGNYDRVASTYDAYAKGNFPPEPQVAVTPVDGAGLSHRVALHLAAGVDHTVSPNAAPMTPRAIAEPALNHWLNSTIPALNRIGVEVSYTDAATRAATEAAFSLQVLNLQPIDLLALLRDDPRQQMTEIDDRIVDHVIRTFAPRPDGSVAIRYREASAEFPAFEVMPLLRQLRKLTRNSRPLAATDLALSNEAKPEQDADVFVDPDRVTSVRDLLQTLHDDLVTWKTGLDALLADIPTNRAALIANSDALVTEITALLSRGALFALPQSGWGFAYDFKRRVFVAVLEKCSGIVRRWDARRAEFQTLMAAYPGLATDTDRFDLLVRAERLITTVATTPFPADPAVFRAQLETVTLPAFQAKRAQFDAMQATTRTSVNGLLQDASLLLPVTDFDPEPVAFDKEEDEAISFARQASSVAGVTIGEAARRLASGNDFIAAHGAAARPPDRAQALKSAAKALLGDDFEVIPEFGISAEQGDELDNALAHSQSPGFLAHLAPLGIDFPVDTWLYGAARVREKLRAWEQLVMNAGALGLAEPELAPLQLPHRPGVPWLGLDIPAGTPLDTDRLLYTAHFSTPFVKTARQCGLLIDDWTETIPSPDATTGVALHYDRPNHEPPQTMLLVTPTQFRGAWQWNDLMDALNETLDFAKLRAVEPVHIDQTIYSRFLPATVKVWTASQLTISANLALNNIATFVSRD